MKKILTLSLLALVFAMPAFGQEKSKETQELTYNAAVTPEFPGGQDALVNFISSNVKYPQAAIDKNAEGFIYVQFVVEKDGSLTNLQVLRGGEASLQAEAIRVIELMPNWTPGKDENGNLVRASQMLPVKFTLSE